MIDRHHLLFDRASWESRPESKLLRQHHDLIIPIDKEVHEGLHTHIPFVPMLGYHVTSRVLREFNGGEPLQAVDNLIMVINESAKHQKAKQIEREVSQVAIHALELQRPWIKEGIAGDNYRSSSKH